MFKFRYKACDPIRILLPIGGVFLVLPWIFKDALMNFYAFVIFSFFGAYFFFLNFPSIGEVLHGKPIYVEDLILINDNDTQRDETFKMLYAVIMNLVLAILFTVFAEYVIIKGIEDKPLIEIFAIIGGNLSLYMKTQNTIGKFLIYFCYNCKEERKRKTSLDISMSKSVSNSIIKPGMSKSEVEMVSKV